MAFTTPYLKLDALVGLVQPTAVLPLSPANHWTNITRFYTPQSKESDYSHLKVKGVCVCVCEWGGVGGHGFLDVGCHGFLSKGFGIMHIPLLMSVQRGETEGRERARERGGEEKEGSWKRRGGRGGGEGEAACCS